LSLVGSAFGSNSANDRELRFGDDRADLGPHTLLLTRRAPPHRVGCGHDATRGVHILGAQEFAPPWTATPRTGIESGALEDAQTVEAPV
jgi:hypothetical protein